MLFLMKKLVFSAKVLFVRICTLKSLSLLRIVTNIEKSYTDAIIDVITICFFIIKRSVHIDIHQFNLFIEV